MRVLGVRCSPKDFSYCILEGTKSNPVLLHTDEIRYPQSYAKPPILKWLNQEVDDLIKKHSVTAIAIKSPEGIATRGKSFVERIELETIFIFAGANLGLKPIVKKVKATIAKDLGVKGKAKYLTNIDSSKIPGFTNFSDKLKEAILVGWSELL